MKLEVLLSVSNTVFWCYPAVRQVEYRRDDSGDIDELTSPTLQRLNFPYLTFPLLRLWDDFLVFLCFLRRILRRTGNVCIPRWLDLCGQLPRRLEARACETLTYRFSVVSAGSGTHTGEWRTSYECMSPVNSCFLRRLTNETV